MPPKVSPIWQYFEEKDNDHSVVMCKIVGCKKPSVSRGKTGTARSNLTNTSMTTHLANHHPSKSKEFGATKDKVAAEKRKYEEDHDDEMENSTVQIFNLRVQSQRQKFLQQSTISS